MERPAFSLDAFSPNGLLRIEVADPSIETGVNAGIITHNGTGDVVAKKRQKKGNSGGVVARRKGDTKSRCLKSNVVFCPRVGLTLKVPDPYKEVFMYVHV